MKHYQKFIFDSYAYDPDAKRISLRYSLDDKIKFEETFDLLGEVRTDYNAEALDRALFGLWIMAGASYYKTALPEMIEIHQGGLSQEQADFFERTYRQGLGEFLYRNELDPKRPINFPVAGHGKGPVEISGLDGALVPIGGGKDSIVTTELVKSGHIDATTFRVGQYEQLKPLLETTGTEHFQVRRVLSPELERLNQEGAYNGHVPITGILSFLAVAVAILIGRKDVVFSNEWSAGEGNVMYDGLEINHQYTKSFGFEQDLQEYLRDNVSPSLNYFSLLRPLSELKIAEVFIGRYFDTYHKLFSSCNRNFHLGTDNPIKWCGECPKCAFVFLLFSPFLDKFKLMDLFGGKNLFESPLLEDTYHELLGLSGHKPFECVGEIEECRQAVIMAQATGKYPELDKFAVTDPGFDYRELHPAAMPAIYEDLIKKL